MTAGIPRHWDARQVEIVLTTESRQKARALFLQTHHPFRRIWVDFSKEDDSSGSFVTEDRVKAHLESGPLQADNRLFFIVGEAGSGKSELCQWLEYQVDTTKRLPIHVPRSLTNAAAVVALLRQKLEHRPAPQLSRTPLSTQAEQVALSSLVLLYERGSQVLTPVTTWAPVLRSREYHQALERYLQDTHLGTGPDGSLIDESIVHAMCLAGGLTLPDDQLPTITLEIKQLALAAMEQSLWLADLHDLLTQLSEQAIRSGRRPLLLIEDITAFQTLGDKLLDYLLDLTSGHFDAVIGVTTGFERSQLGGATLAGDLTHIHHRLRARYTLTDERGRSYGLEDDLIEFVRRYLQAIRSPDADPIVDGDTSFDADLYPFSETCLLRSFQALQEEGNPRQTPRLLLNHIVRPVLLSGELPGLVLDRSTFLQPPPTLFHSEDVIDPALQSLLRWYGDITDEAVTLDVRLAAGFNVAVPSHLVHAGHIRAPRIFVVPPQQLEADRDWGQELREFQHWVLHGGLYPKRETLKRGIERVLLSLGDPRALGNPDHQSLFGAHFYYSRGEEWLPISLGRGSGDQPGTDTYAKVEVVGHAGERAVLEEMVYLAATSTPLAEVCRNVALTLEWAQGHWDAYHQQIQAIVAARLGGVRVDHLVWAGWGLVSALAGNPWMDSPATGSVDAPSYAGTSLWSPRQHGLLYSTGEKLFPWHQAWRRLFAGLFTLREGLVDRNRWETVQRAFDGVGTLKRLAGLTPNRLRSLPLKIRPSGEAFVDLLTGLQPYAKALDQLRVKESWAADWRDLTDREKHLTRQLRRDTSRLEAKFVALRWWCGDVGVPWSEAAENAAEVLRRLDSATLADLLEHIRRLRQEQADTYGSSDVWAYLQFRSRYQPLVRNAYWTALATLRQTVRDLSKGAADRYHGKPFIMTQLPSHRLLQRARRSLWREIGLT